MFFKIFRYGLILPDKKGTKKAPPIFTSTNVFGEDSDSDDSAKLAPKRAIVTSGDKIKRQVRKLIHTFVLLS